MEPGRWDPQDRDCLGALVVVESGVGGNSSRGELEL